MALQTDQRGRPIYYDVDRLYDQAGFNELLLNLSQTEGISSIDAAAVADDIDFRQRYRAAQLAQGDNPMDWAIQQEAAQRYGPTAGMFGVLPGGEQGDYQQRTDPATGETYFTRRLMSGGPGDNHNTFRLGEEFGARDDQDWYLEARYGADGQLQDISPVERRNESGWLQFREAIKPVAIMAAMVAGGGWLAQAQAAAQASAAAGAAGTGAASTATPGLAQWAAGQGITSAAPLASTIPGTVSTSQALLGAGGVAGAAGGITGAEALRAMVAADQLAAATAATAGTATQAATPAATGVLGQVAQAARDYGPLLAAGAGALAGQQSTPGVQQPQAPIVPGAEAPPEARGYQAARDPIIDVLNRNRRRGRNSTMLTGYGGVPMDSVRTGGNSLLGL